MRCLPVLLVALFIAACPKPPPPTPEPARACRVSDVTADMDGFGAVEVFVSAGGLDPRTREDVAGVLGTMWGLLVSSVKDGAPQGSADAFVWIASSEDARTASGATITRGYVHKRITVDGKPTLLVYSPDEDDLSAGAYALLETLGARFFHPKDAFIPAFGRPFFPRALDVTRTPMTDVRGIHLHLLHPTEYLKPFDEAGAQNLEDAKQFIDWLARTGQNHVQWWIMDTMDLTSWQPHARAIIDYAHARHMTVGVEVMMFAASSLQNGFELIQTSEDWQPQMDASLAFLMELPWDLVEVNLGEFSAANPEGLLDWLNHLTAWMRMNHPATRVSVVNHVGNYEHLYVDFRGMEDVFFYHLPGYADPDLINAVHTVFWYDIYRDRGMYEHPDFHLQRDYILQELPERPVRYFPESAYWVTADVDVPVFLSEFITSRWNDIHNLDADIRSRNLPALDGHVVFSSGHEWAYWMIDYLTARALWMPQVERDDLFAHVAAIHGACAGDVAQSLVEFTDLQSDVLYEGNLIAYISGEDVHDDLGAQAGILTQPRRVQYDELLAMDDAARAAFERDVVEKLEALHARLRDEVRPRLAKVCADDDAALQAWCNELLDGVEILELRTLHAATLNRAVLKSIADSRSDWDQTLREAAAIRGQAQSVVNRRSEHYRFPKEILTTAHENPTVYKFGYLKQAQDLCFWRRQEAQADAVIRTGAAPGLLEIPTCVQ